MDTWSVTETRWRRFFFQCTCCELNCTHESWTWQLSCPRSFLRMKMRQVWEMSRIHYSNFYKFNINELLSGDKGRGSSEILPKSPPNLQSQDFCFVWLDVGRRRNFILISLNGLLSLSPACFVGGFRLVKCFDKDEICCILLEFWGEFRDSIEWAFH